VRRSPHGQFVRISIRQILDRLACLLRPAASGEYVDLGGFVLPGERVSPALPPELRPGIRAYVEMLPAAWGPEQSLLLQSCKVSSLVGQWRGLPIGQTAIMRPP
jgi:hypothetical protein